MLNAKIPTFLGIIVIILLSFTDGVGQKCSASNPEVKAVRRVANAIIRADNRRELHGVLSLYADNAVLMPPNEEPVKGIDAIRGRYETLFAAFNPFIEGRIDEVCVGDRLGFVRGYNGGQLIPISGGEPRQLDDTYLMLLKRNRKGVWRITHLIWHHSH